MPTGRSPYTIEAYIKPSTSSNEKGGIAGWGNYGKANEVNAFRMDGWSAMNNYWWDEDLTSATSATSNIDLRDGEWHHVAAAFDGTTRSITIDNEVVVSDTPTGNAAASVDNFCVGCTNNECFTGSMKGFRIHNAARLGDPPPPAPPQQPSPPSSPPHVPSPPSQPSPSSPPPAPPAPPLNPPRVYNDVRVEGASDVWTDAGGTCTCPSGKTYTVGWSWSTKGLACNGGTAGPCTGLRSDGNGCNDIQSDGAEVTCDTSA